MEQNTICDNDLNFESVFCDDLRSTNIFKNAINDLNVMHINIRSIKKNFDELLVFLESLGGEMDVLVLSETNNVIHLSNFNINNYHIVYNESTLNKCDGCIAYIKNEIFVDTTVININNHKFLRTIVSKNNVSVGVTSIYRLCSLPVDEFLSDLDMMLNQLKLGYCNIEIFTGDLNINLLDLANINVNRYLNSLSANGFYSLINIPTRVDKSSSSCLDHFFVRGTTNVSGIVLNSHLTDHFPIFLNICLNSNNKKENKSKYCIKLNHDLLRELLVRETWDDLLGVEDSDRCTVMFIDKLKKMLDESTSSYYVKCKHRRIKPWITQSLIDSIRQRDKLKKISSKDPNNIVLLENYKSYRKNLTKLINKTKVDYFSNLFEQNKNDTKKTWDLIKKSTNEGQLDKGLFTIINENNVEITDSGEIANEFNFFFASIGERLAGNIQNTQIANLSGDPSSCESLFLGPIRESELIEIIRSLKNGASFACDGISNKIIKDHHLFLVKPLLHLVNTVLATGKYPKIFKESIIIPLHKSGSKKLMNNYRPIALNSNVSKIIEKCIKLRLMNFAESKKLISPDQFGFRESRGIDDALIRVANHVSLSLDNKEKCLLIFLDLKKAFDTVSHHILLDKLYKFGLRGTTQTLIKSYLEDRTQKVKIGEHISNSCLVRCGVPQGTVLGPILFTVYINSMLSLLNEGEMVCYADDTVLLFRDACWQLVMRKLKNL